MNQHAKAVIIFIILLFLLPKKAYANNAYTYYYNGVSDQNYIITREVFLDMPFTVEEKGYILFKKLLTEIPTDLKSYIPAESELLNVVFINGCLYVNVSKSITNYGGGTSWEYLLMQQLTKTAFSIEGVKEFTLLVEGESNALPEGTITEGISADECESFYTIGEHSLE